MPWNQTTHQKFAMPMTAASVAQRRMGFKAPRAQKNEGQSPYLVSQGFSRGGVTNRRREGPSLSGFSRGGYMATLMAGHRKMEESKQVRDDPSTSQALKTHQGRAQGADQAPLAAIARVSAAKSETWILVLCLRMYSMKGVLTRGTNEETGSQVSWDGP